MIGQQKLLNNIDRMISSDFPRFIILVGENGSGKRTVSHEIANKLGALAVEADIKVEAVREIISVAYKIPTPTLYIFPEADKMSVSAKNALLKVTEEPPKRAYFVMTVNDTSQILATLRSRATVLKLDNYSPTEIEEFAKLYFPKILEDDLNILSSVCSNALEVKMFCDYGIQEFYNYCRLVVDNIYTANAANALKIGAKLNFKKEEDGIPAEGVGYPVPLFMKTVMHLFSQKVKETRDPLYLEALRITSKYLTDINITGINKSATIDMWIIEIREAFNGSM